MTIKEQQTSSVRTLKEPQLSLHPKSTLILTNSNSQPSMPNADYYSYFFYSLFESQIKKSISRTFSFRRPKNKFPFQCIHTHRHTYGSSASTITTTTTLYLTSTFTSCCKENISFERQTQGIRRRRHTQMKKKKTLFLQRWDLSINEVSLLTKCQR
jgi:hypothetical protein